MKEESGLELYDDPLVPVVVKLQKVRDAIELTSFQNSIEVHILLTLHVVQVYPLHLDNWHSLLIEHRVVAVLVKESPETLIDAPFLG
jgi:hypothetical protein